MREEPANITDLIDRVKETFRNEERSKVAYEEAVKRKRRLRRDLLAEGLDVTNFEETLDRLREERNRLEDEITALLGEIESKLD
jgi:predicted nuclease with TOPRIM domain